MEIQKLNKKFEPDQVLLDTEMNQITSKIDEIIDNFPKESSNVGKFDTNSDGTGEIFNDYINNVATGNKSHAEGEYTISIGNTSHAEGTRSISYGERSHVEGYVTEGERSQISLNITEISGFTLRGTTNVLNYPGVIEINGNYILLSSVTDNKNGTYTYTVDKEITNELVIGDNNIVYQSKGISIGQNSHTEGQESSSVGINSHAEGYSTKSLGGQSHSEGYQSISSGDNSHAEGQQTTASGVSSHSSGYRTTAKGNCSYAGGNSSIANGDNSHAEGFETISDNFAQFSIGRHNKADSNPSSIYNVEKPAFVIGNGTSTSSRADAFRVRFNGNTESDGNYSTPAADYAEFFEWKDGNPEKEDRVGYFVTLVGKSIVKATQSSKYILGIVSSCPGVIGDNPMRWKNKYLTDEWGRPIYEDVEVTYEEVVDGETITKSKVERVFKVNPEYKSDLEYVPRSDRPEWDTIGLMGKLLVRQDGTLIEGDFCRPGENGVATKSDSGYYVMEVLNNKQALIMFR